MSRRSNEKFCCACLNNNLDLNELSKKDENKVDLLTKLQTCISEIEWLLSYQICDPCENLLNVIYNFRDTCIKSDNIRKQENIDSEEIIKEELIYEEEQTNELDIKNESSDDEFMEQYLENNESTNNIDFLTDLEDKLDLDIEYDEKEKTRRKTQQFTCEKCQKIFNSSIQLVNHCVDDHEMKIKDVRPFTCDSSHKLVVHTDSNRWKYQCEICNKPFPIKSNYDSHMRRHTGDKKFACLLCQKKFTDKCGLQRHLKTHSDVREHKCKHCEKAYKDERVMKVHMAKIHGIGLGEIKLPSKERKYICHICQKAYYAKYRLTSHLYTHSGEKPYHCHMCDKKFNDKSYVRQHLIKSHNIKINMKDINEKMQSTKEVSIVTCDPEVVLISAI